MSISSQNGSVQVIEPEVSMSERGAVLVLVYNETEHGEECIRSLEEHLPEDVSVVLIDNCSDENLAVHFKEQFPWIHSLRNSENSGYAGGNNVGAEYAIQRGAQKVYYLNDDTVVCPNFWQACEQDLYQQEAGVVGSVILHHHEPEIMQEAGKYWNIDQFRCYTRGVNERYDSIDNKFKECDSVCGAGFMATSDVIDKTGGFEKEFFYYYEETDLCLRAKEHGIRVGISGESKVLHKGSQTIGSISPMSAYHAIRNYGWLVRRHASGMKSYMYGVIRVLRLMGSYLKQSTQKKDAKSAKAALKGAWRGFFGSLPQI